MSAPSLPWYSTIEKYFAPSDSVATTTLIVLAVITLVVAILAPTIMKVAWAVYLISP